MKGYRIFVGVFLLLLTLYIIAEINRPEPIDWNVTLSKGDKNPFGGYVLFNRLKDIFPNASVESFRTPVYDQVNDFYASNTAYILGGQTIDFSENDVEELLNYVSEGNYVFLASSQLSKKLMDTLHFDFDVYFNALSTDSTTINFTDPALKSNDDYTFKRHTIGDFFSKFDTTRSTVLSINDRNRANYIRMPFGEGYFFIHANPVMFSNYFMLTGNNAEYTANALSYIPLEVDKIYWDEYYKLGPLGAGSPLRFFLGNEYLRWALRLSLIGMLLYVFFETKRRQRVIPVIDKLRNTTVDFIKTIATVYLQQKDNGSIAAKKITYFLEFVRNKYFIPTSHLDEEFIEHLSRKSGVSKEETNNLVQLIYDVQQAQQVTDKYLLVLNNRIDHFYKQVL